jgi:hypothetical protein
MSKRVAVLQSNYLPWKGYFDIISKADVFVFYDDVKFTKNDWRNRNQIKGPKGLRWITIPCGHDYNRLIYEVELMDASWQRLHWEIIKLYYRKAPFYKDYFDFFEDFYLNRIWQNLSSLNQYLIKDVCNMLEIKTKFEDSRDYFLNGSKSDRLLNLLNKMNTTTYITGPSAKNYLNEHDFNKSGITIEWINYEGYPQYPQLFPPFIHKVSIIDLLFNTGKEARKFLNKE